MYSNQSVCTSRVSCKEYLALFALFVLTLCGGTRCVDAQVCSFSSTSDGSDGNYDLSGTPAGATVYFNASNFHGTGVANNIFNFNQITIPANVTVKFTENVFHGPVYWLAQGDVNIAGTLDLTGDDANLNITNVTLRKPGTAGSGGYPGGVGGGGNLGFVATSGGGPGGGAAGVTGGPQNGGGYSGSFVGSNDYLVPLVGGSGGGGGVNGVTNFGFGGAGGGGAILIASSTSVAVSGAISANGGSAGNCGSAGSGGAILIKANSIVTPGNPTYISALGGSVSCAPTAGTPGLVRLEACSVSGGGNVLPAPLTTTPTKLFLPTSPAPSVQVTSVNGTAITENPFSFPDITINTPSAVPVVITAHQVPVGTVPTLFVFSETGDKQLTCPIGGLQGTLDTSSCSVNITFPFGGSRGFVKATWSQ